ncbi:hypothetical protein [Polynucleobacter sp. MWH-Svant-W18]|jgi:hypothetical protein|uniref:hypothetical protein n=1 Tax=Polynucleobacter sp. MWH-Svant-W18 TaxID=1855909 RepID=UPI001BFE42FD|nr:hypothetical protein [Polynucleobacter sp. MWH-Svant-W18]QWD77975.1 hypothetical protein C2757_08885 [Polynucleobacter sp. MWH-Svant-W18]
MASILSLTEFFENKLEAPMVNNRWSWGAVKSDGSAVYLSIWQDEIKRDDPKDPKSPTWVDVLWDEKLWSGVSEASTARNERIRHIDLIKSGTPAYALIKIAKDPKTIPREMKEFNSDYLIGLKNKFRLTEAGILQAEIGERYPL